MKQVTWTAFARATPIPADAKEVASMALDLGVSIAAVTEAIANRPAEELWKNSLYQVAINREPDQDDDWPKMIHLSIKRLDRQPIHDWRHLQRIKNELVGPDHEAIEIYPAEERLVDTANQYHLWAFADPTVRVPLGFRVRLVIGQTSGKAQQRPFEEAQNQVDPTARIAARDCHHCGAAKGEYCGAQPCQQGVGP